MKKEIEQILAKDEEIHLRLKKAVKAKNEAQAEFDAYLALSKDNMQKLVKFSDIQPGQKVMVKLVKNVGTLLRPEFVDEQGIVAKVIPLRMKTGGIAFRYKIYKMKKDGKASNFMLKRGMSFDREELYIELDDNQN